MGEKTKQAAKTLVPLPSGRRPLPARATMLLRRLLHSSRHFRRGLEAVAPATRTSSFAPSSPLPFRRLPDLLPTRVLSPRLLSTSGRDDDDGNKPWSFAADSGDPYPFAHEDAAADAGEALPVGPAAVADEPWAKGFGVEDGENGDVFEGIYKEAASVAPASGQAAPAGDEEQWTLSGDEKDPLPMPCLGRGSMGSRVRVVQIVHLVNLIASSNITEGMIDSLILLKDVRDVPGLPPLSEIEDEAIEKLNATSSRAEVERQKQEEIAKARTGYMDKRFGVWSKEEAWKGKAARKSFQWVKRVGNRFFQLDTKILRLVSNRIMLHCSTLFVKRWTSN
ncbi:hypothetical protein HU200_050728 [Digitaria exilis]|uniref:Uncharacterized protein n=1 Tax=Digitaria exilis TaxID=1010633 RepID=A0A835ANT0_9POAL|nr:hypothetical protein HU200_050728 [Digitaria exilis]